MKQRFYFRSFAAGGSNPDPAIYCPANGYAPLEEPWIPPFTPIAINNEEIILFCDDSGYGIIRLTVTVSSGGTKLECIDVDGNILSTYSGAISNYTFTFPTKDTDTYYQIRISPNTIGASILSLGFSTPTGYSDNDFSIYKIQFKTPNITSVSGLTNLNYHVKEVEFIGACNSLTDINNAFKGGALTKLTLPSSMLALIYMSGTFSSPCALKIVDLSGYVLDNLLIGSGAFSGFKGDILKLPLSMPALQTCQNMYYQSTPKVLQIPATSNLVSFASGMDGCTYPGEIVIPDSPNIGSGEFATAFRNSYFKKVTFPVTDDKTLNHTGFASSYIQEIVFSTNMANVVQLYMATQKRLKYITVPVSAPLLTTIYVDSPFFVKIKNAPDYSGQVIKLDLYSWSLEEVNWPTVRVNYLRAGMSSSLRATLLTSVNIDWANSQFSGTGTVIFIYGSLDATELNRIFTALPAPVSGNPRIDVRYTTGYATCTKTIATAKGYVVL